MRRLQNSLMSLPLDVLSADTSRRSGTYMVRPAWVDLWRALIPGAIRSFYWWRRWPGATKSAIN